MGNGDAPAARLAALLDAPDDAPEPSASDAMVTDDLAAVAAAEHEARVRAEGAAADAASRLTVFQDQMTEWAAAREADAAAAAAEAGAAVEAARAAAGTPAGDAALAAAAALHDRLAAAAREAAAFAALTKADADRAKRALSTGSLAGAAANGGTDSAKRARGDGRPTRRSAAAAAGGSEDEPPASDDTPHDAPASSAAPPAHPPTEADASRARARAKCTPLRLTPQERHTLGLLKAALSVSDYVGAVDVLSWRSKTGRIVAQIKSVCAVLCGLVVASDFRRGQALIADKDLADLGDFFGDAFEVARRHKIMCPEAMRGEYGKLMYMLMDSTEPAVRELLGFDCVRPLKTVWTLLEAGGATALLDDPLLPAATAEIDGSRNRPRAAIQRDIKAKEAARATLARRYARPACPEPELLRALYSLSDAAAFLTFARDPVDAALAALEATFPPGPPPCAELSLAIHGGSDGARLTHSHATQFTYVRQSLVLWREVQDALYALWAAAEADLLAPGNGYRLADTGQGLNRVQAAPRTSRAMHALLGRVQQRLGSWVGSSVIHLGDHNVPNALFFLTKYVGVPAILGPLMAALAALPEECERDPELAAYVSRKFGGLDPARTAVLRDFFRHAFDGSGADSWFDAGSCIDGRLTSAWNWCERWQAKPYANLLRAAGLAGFSEVLANDK